MIILFEVLDYQLQRTNIFLFGVFFLVTQVLRTYSLEDSYAKYNQFFVNNFCLMAC